MKKVALGFSLMCLLSANITWAGCIGPTIMGKCEGTEVPWDTHLPGQEHPDPPAGFYWDWRGSEQYQRNPQDINPFTGWDPHDSHWHDLDWGKR